MSCHPGGDEKSILGGGVDPFPSDAGENAKITVENVKRLPHEIHPRRLTWNIIMEVWKMIFLFK